MRVPQFVRSFSLAATGTLLLTAGLAQAQNYTQTNITSDGSVPAANTDPNLKNPWGLSRSSGGPWWVSDNATGLSTLYDGTGAAQKLVVSVPGQPTGTIFNGSQDFQIKPGFPAVFLFASEDGTISAWNPTYDLTHARVMISTPNGVYKGLTAATADGKQYLYAPNFRTGRIDVFDANFQPVKLSHYAFEFERAENSNFAPFNVQNIGNNIFVAYAKQDAAKHDEVDGAGQGLVAAFTSEGRLIRVYEHGSFLNSPWGLAEAPSDFGAFSHDLLVGNFGSGEILAYNILSGRLDGKLLDTTGKPIHIEGLWAIATGNGASAGPANTLYFAAGPNSENGGLLGTLTALAAQQTPGNDR